MLGEGRTLGVVAVGAVGTGNRHGRMVAGGRRKGVEAEIFLVLNPTYVILSYGVTEE